MKDKTLNIFFVLDKNYIIPFTVTLTSILENNKDLAIQVFVIHELEQKDLLNIACKFFIDRFNQEIKLIYFEDNYFKDFSTSEHITKAGYLKLLLGKMIPESIISGLYMDSDIVVTGSLKEIANLSFHDDEKEVFLFAANDIRADREIKRLNMAGADITSYFNSGVFYLNLRKWRAENVAERMIKVGEEYNDHLAYLDQDILNIFFKADYKELDDTYNREAAKKHAELPLVLHYMGDSKPWHFVDNGPYKHIYHKYLKMTPFRKHKVETITVEKIARKYVRLIRSKFTSAND